MYTHADMRCTYIAALHKSNLLSQPSLRISIRSIYHVSRAHGPRVHSYIVRIVMALSCVMCHVSCAHRPRVHGYIVRKQVALSFVMFT